MLKSSISVVFPDILLEGSKRELFRFHSFNKVLNLSPELGKVERRHLVSILSLADMENHSSTASVSKLGKLGLVAMPMKEVILRYSYPDSGYVI